MLGVPTYRAVYVFGTYELRIRVHDVLVVSRAQCNYLWAEHNLRTIAYGFCSVSAKYKYTSYTRRHSGDNNNTPCREREREK